MKVYLISLGVGVLAGILYGILGVRSPAPPAIALVGLLGILIGEQLVPVAKRIVRREPVVACVRTDCAAHILGPQAAPAKLLSPEGDA